MSIGPALLLFLGSLLVAREATRHRPAAFLPAALLLATSIWLLTQGRWACDVVFTSMLVAWSVGTVMTAARTGSRTAAVLSGVLLGLAQYGYVQSRLALLAAPAVAVYAALRGRKELLRLAATVTGLASFGGQTSCRRNSLTPVANMYAFGNPAGRGVPGPGARP